MSRSRPHLVAPRGRVLPGDGPIRLDLVTNPYGPSVHVLDVLSGAGDLHLPSGTRETKLQLRLAHVLGVPPDWLVLASGIDELLRMILLWRMGRGPIVLFPPSDPADDRRAAQFGMDIVRLPRGPAFSLGLEPTGPRLIPPGATALIGSPNDPTGTLLSTQDAVRLTRACELVLIDERYGEYSHRTLVPFTREFSNIIVLQSFETWAGLAGLPFAYAIGPPALLRELATFAPPDGVAMGAVLAATATLDDLAYVRATVQRVREERSRLYRMLRKLNMIQPYPSWANFMLTRVERGDADRVAIQLARRGIQVHRPRQAALDRCLRISATLPEHTDALKSALIDLAVDLD